MKSVIIATVALALSANAQFNFEVNGGGFRFGILGAQVVNIGSKNAGRPFQDSGFPVSTINQVQKKIDNMLPHSGPQIIYVPTPTAPAPQQIKSEASKQLKPQVQKEKAQQKKVEIKQQMNDKNAKSAEQKQVQQEIQEPKGKEEQKIDKPAIQQDIGSGKKGQIIPKIIDVSGEDKKEQSELQLIRQKQDEKLIHAIKLMPQSEKQHLRAIMNQKVQN